LLVFASSILSAIRPESGSLSFPNPGLGRLSLLVQKASQLRPPHADVAFAQALCAPILKPRWAFGVVVVDDVVVVIIA
jgi:hypothetical protein